MARKRKREHSRQAHARKTHQLLRIGAFAVIVFAVIAAAFYFLAPVFEPMASGVTHSGNFVEVNIQAMMDGFDMKEIRVKVTERVRLNLRSLDNEHHTDGGGKHQFAIDELGVNIIAQPLSVNSGTFVATKAGSYSFYCDICCGGRANPTMNGKLVVEEA